MNLALLALSRGSLSCCLLSHITLLLTDQSAHCAKLHHQLCFVLLLPRRLSFANNGGSKALRPPRGATPGKPLLIELVHFERQLQLADDGCFVETGGPTSAHMRYNWCTGSGKEGLRFDGSDKTGTANGEMSYNVVWNNSGFGVKGNNHSAWHKFACSHNAMHVSAHCNCYACATDSNGLFMRLLLVWIWQLVHF